MYLVAKTLRGFFKRWKRGSGGRGCEQLQALHGGVSVVRVYTGWLCVCVVVLRECSFSPWRVL